MINEKYPMNRLLSAIWISTAGYGGLLVFPAIKPYFWMVIIPICFTYLAYHQLINVKSRKILLLISVIDLIIGTIIGQIFYTNGELSNAGIVIVFFAFAISAVSLRGIWAAETGS